MTVIRHPKLADDIRKVATHYEGISAKLVTSFWNELESAIHSIEENPRIHHFDSSGLRRANLKRFPYHLLYEIEDDTLFLLVLRHDKRAPQYGTGRKN